MRETLPASIALEALDMAIRRQRPAPGLIQHSDRGIQYASDEYRQALAAAKITPSMSRKRYCLESKPDRTSGSNGPGNRSKAQNAPMESFFHTLKVERDHHRIHTTRAEARRDLFAYIVGILQFTPPAFRDRLLITGRHGAHGGLTQSAFQGGIMFVKAALVAVAEAGKPDRLCHPPGAGADAGGPADGGAGQAEFVPAD